MKRTILGLLVLAVFSLGSACGQSSRVAKLESANMAELITLQQAIGIAQQAVPDGWPIGADLELEDDDENEPPAYEVVFFVPGDNQIVEVEVHAQSGDVLEVEVGEDGDDDANDADK